VAAVDNDPARRRLEQQRRDVQPGQDNDSATRTQARTRIGVHARCRREVRLRSDVMGAIQNVATRMMVVR
jgi:hypothetical protein